MEIIKKSFSTDASLAFMNLHNARIRFFLLLFFGNAHVHKRIKAFVQESILLLFISIGSPAMPAVPWRSQSFPLSFVSVMILYLQKPLGARNLFVFLQQTDRQF